MMIIFWFCVLLVVSLSVNIFACIKSSAKSDFPRSRRFFKQQDLKPNGTFNITQSENGCIEPLNHNPPIKVPLYSVISQTGLNSTIVIKCLCNAELSNQPCLVNETSPPWSTPPFLTLKTSSIKNAGLGVFTRIDLKQGLLFGPYGGERRSLTNVYTERSAYIWAILGVDNSSRPKIESIVDADNKTKSNWLRYINSAGFREQQNLVPLQHNDNVYYYLFRNILEGDELLAYYGMMYHYGLGYKLLNTTTARKYLALAPPLVDVELPKSQSPPLRILSAE